ncbi:MFS transporter [Streptomyces sp. PSKA54]|uniref:MFS transporter n=1 Tax=Streptomyces himalayensis subsp. aureolus TaxID=2758039 RepID=A0A7W2D4F6_9ACTN|nr:MFS transporter [Streptomyces himalayensis]MBA4864295.1 MFS transporter [Streptomyces himalayensis subsp. aureolus]
MRRSAHAAVCLTVFIDLLGFTITLPGLPLHAASMGASGAAVGILMAAYSLAQFAAAPWLGRLSDRYGRRPLLLLSLAGSAAALALTGAATSLWQLVAARALAGACGGSISVAHALVAETTAPQHRTRAMGYLGASIAAAFVVGPALGAASSGAGFGFTALAYAAACLAAGNLVWAAAVVPRRSAPGGLQPAPEHGRRSLEAVGTPGPVILCGFLATCAFAALEGTYALLGHDRYGLDAWGVGWALAAGGLAMALVQMSLVGPLARRWPEARMAAVGALVAAVSLAAVPLLPLPAGITALCLLSAGHALITPALSSLLSKTAPPERMGALMGAQHSAAAAARAVGPACAGFLYDYGAVLAYGVAALMAAAAAAVISLNGARGTAVRLTPGAASRNIGELPERS